MMLWSLLWNIFILRGPGAANFADIIKIVTMFIKKILQKTQKKLKELEIMYQNANYICIFWYIFWFSAAFHWENADISRNQEVCQMIN